MDPNRIREKRQSKSERDREREERPHFGGAHEQLNIRVCSAALFPQCLGKSNNNNSNNNMQNVLNEMPIKVKLK